MHITIIKNCNLTLRGGISCWLSVCYKKTKQQHSWCNSIDHRRSCLPSRSATRSHWPMTLSSLRRLVPPLSPLTHEVRGDPIIYIAPFYVLCWFLRVGTLRAQHSECVPSHSFTHHAAHTLATLAVFVVPSSASIFVALRTLPWLFKAAHKTTRQSQFPRSYVRKMQPILQRRSHFL